MKGPAERCRDGSAQRNGAETAVPSGTVQRRQCPAERCRDGSAQRNGAETAVPSGTVQRRQCPAERCRDGSAQRNGAETAVPSGTVLERKGPAERDGSYLRGAVPLQPSGGPLPHGRLPCDACSRLRWVGPEPLPPPPPGCAQTPPLEQVPCGAPGPERPAHGSAPRAGLATPCPGRGLRPVDTEDRLGDAASVDARSCPCRCSIFSRSPSESGRLYYVRMRRTVRMRTGDNTGPKPPY
ncbi:hypothetical protein NDU88_000675 [Pleurodeles waltl]|uniref:Uncharacterized protein n=1 Tax=Pleurodeles waltl TaxID=8319 RepID=A0AAV7N8T4_PLEWA|nr:hypothetical protein NDU88_000675 [Pleurodeles waltl]